MILVRNKDIKATSRDGNCSEEGYRAPAVPAERAVSQPAVLRPSFGVPEKGAVGRRISKFHRKVGRMWFH